jgi:ferrous iron transport protein A
MKLSELTIGQSAHVMDVTGDDAIAVRLLEMGLVDGVEITLLGAAPMGDPLEYLIRGSRLSLRRAEAQRVEVDASAISPR